MKTKDTTTASTAFTPRSIEITFETQAEMDAIATLCNHAFIVDAVRDTFEGGGAAMSSICHQIRDLGGEQSRQLDKMGDLIHTYFDERRPRK